ncbi:MAG: hypothetical protein WBN04_16890 [Paracoccaceae bacterium]
MATETLFRGVMILAAGLSSSAYAAGTSQSMAEAQVFAEAFTGICAQNSGRNDKVAAFARIMKFEELSSEMALAMGPQDSDAEFKGWIVVDETGLKYLLGVSQTRIDGKMLAACTIANPNLNTNDVVENLKGLLSLGEPRMDEEYAGQRTRAWSANGFGDGSSVYLVNAVRPTVEGATVSLRSPK